MNFLNKSDLKNKPILKFIIITFVVGNAIVLAILLFGFGRFIPSKSRRSGNVSAPANVTSEEPEQTIEEDNRVEEDRDSAPEAEEETDSANGNTGEVIEEVEESEETEEAENPAPENGPVLELVSDHVTLEVGSRFNFYDYIETMVDSDGSSLSRYIHLDGNVDTSKPGDYTITYKITSPVTGITASKDLLITVEE